MTTLPFQAGQACPVIVCPPVGPAGEDVGATFWPVFAGGGFCGVSCKNLHSAGRGTIAPDDRGHARIDP